jgi:hypothetical protein
MIFSLAFQKFDAILFTSAQQNPVTFCDPEGDFWR